MSSEDALVLDATASTVAAARRFLPWYAGDFSPVHADQLAHLLKRATCHLLVRPFHSDALAFTLPPIRGAYILAVNRDASPADRVFAIRHELGHVLAGHVEEPTFLSEDDYRSRQERVADLFALADLVPGWSLGMMRRRRAGWRRILAEIRREIDAGIAKSWPEERTQDRARLRLALYRECRV